MGEGVPELHGERVHGDVGEPMPSDPVGLAQGTVQEGDTSKLDCPD